MNEEQRIWWQEVADQYREWAYDPPRSSNGKERYTCPALRDADVGWLGVDVSYCLRRLWVPCYGWTNFPIGPARKPDRDERRFDFCHHVADVIEDWLENGELP
jgi:hypothetical protein